MRARTPASRTTRWRWSSSAPRPPPRSSRRSEQARLGEAAASGETGVPKKTEPRGRVRRRRPAGGDGGASPRVRGRALRPRAASRTRSKRRKQTPPRDVGGTQPAFDSDDSDEPRGWTRARSPPSSARRWGRAAAARAAARLAGAPRRTPPTSPPGSGSSDASSALRTAALRTAHQLGVEGEDGLGNERGSYLRPRRRRVRRRGVQRGVRARHAATAGGHGGAARRSRPETPRFRETKKTGGGPAYARGPGESSRAGSNPRGFEGARRGVGAAAGSSLVRRQRRERRRGGRRRRAAGRRPEPRVQRAQELPASRRARPGRRRSSWRVWAWTAWGSGTCTATTRRKTRRNKARSERRGAEWRQESWRASSSVEKCRRVKEKMRYDISSLSCVPDTSGRDSRASSASPGQRIPCDGHGCSRPARVRNFVHSSGCSRSPLPPPSRRRPRLAAPRWSAAPRRSPRVASRARCVPEPRSPARRPDRGLGTIASVRPPRNPNPLRSSHVPRAGHAPGRRAPRALVHRHRRP